MISTSGSGQMMPLPMNAFLQQSMKLGGFDLDFEVVEWGAMLLGYRSVPDAPTSKGVDVLNISLSYTDPSSMFRYWHSSSYSPTNQNWGHWSTPHPMACCSRRSKLSILRCATGYWQKRALVVDEAPWVWIARDLDRRAMSAKVKGFHPAQSWSQDFTSISMD